MPEPNVPLTSLHLARDQVHFGWSREVVPVAMVRSGDGEVCTPNRVVSAFLPRDLFID